MKSIPQLLASALPLFALASITLGLAPFTPEPHIWEKIRWIATGQMPNEAIYWFDFAMHGAPWALLIASIVAKIVLSRQKTAAQA